jgi:hypothetical protein
MGRIAELHGTKINGLSLEASNQMEAKALFELKSGLQQIGKTFDFDLSASGNIAEAIIAKRQEIAGLQAAVRASSLPEWKKTELGNTLGGLSGQLRRAGGRLALQGCV